MEDFLVRGKPISGLNKTMHILPELTHNGLVFDTAVVICITYTQVKIALTAWLRSFISYCNHYCLAINMATCMNDESTCNY